MKRQLLVSGRGRKARNDSGAAGAFIWNHYEKRPGALRVWKFWLRKGFRASSEAFHSVRDVNVLPGFLFISNYQHRASGVTDNFFGGASQENAIPTGQAVS